MKKGESPDEIKAVEIPKLSGQVTPSEFLNYLAKAKVKAKAFHITDSGYKFPIYPVIYSEGFKDGKFSDRKSTRLNSSHRCISYAVFCLTKNSKSSPSSIVRTVSTTQV